jgi:protein ImuB
MQPVDVLPLDSTELETLARWGMKTIGDLANLPEDSLVARFGGRGTMMAKLSRGEQEAVLRAYEPPPELEEKQDLDWLVGELEPLSFLLSGLLERLCLKLQGLNSDAPSPSVRCRCRARPKTICSAISPGVRRPGTSCRCSCSSVSGAMARLRAAW